VTNYNSELLKQKILETLESHPEGLTIESLSDMVGAHRQTVAKYLLWLDGARVVHRRRVGSATLHYLKKFVRSFGKSDV
jgi:DNA-binding IclR family transcriptional regulator